MKNAINLLLWYFYPIYKKKDILEEKEKRKCLFAVPNFTRIESSLEAFAVDAYF